ncbi:unsaturated glucuronyl hydrolase [Buttiauxella ferragutiae ATCC 51602]|jgi:unsaturated chondroitin disaccharide hydrolase|uniref:Unsaturated glucuronyl hydrolase n=1 Tax=Buttiauxella ferragutiae ATCC 51602 TaxID=1354252 RepID=A0ABX2W6R1_9ENTR|nr:MULTISPECIES: glycoside hydrolase family 88 protein [Buttiauxella]OAT26610.1 unsaturated glucuronyl hydrolase [Buttiauxella ferragutiae ATCC 51602]TDN54762.1 unsaturated chondroitin disaccharide hydrolase [Buttiauxella sp. JUb87]UNK63283.1 glycoside hydrolase family 88 protein [Buttiauxella ferragutiae]
MTRTVATEKVVTEPLRPIELHQVDRLALNRKLDAALKSVTKKLDKNIIALGDKFPNEACEGGKWAPTGNVEWTTSFWTGQLWLMWELTGDDKYRQAAERYLPSFAERLDQRIETATHDLGFLYTLSCINAWRLTGNETARQTALQAADILMERYNPVAKIIQAWGDLNDPEQQGRMIIDCNMNLPLLYWASEQTGDARYAQAATAHAQQAAKYIVRPDSSTFHTFYMDVETGEPRFGNTHQGFSDTSCWSRGQAWGIYGFLLTYLYTGDTSMVDLTRSLAHYFINRLPEDDVCHWDLALLGTDAVRDSSAAAITACGLLELVNTLPVLDEHRAHYEEMALRIIQSLTDNYLARDDEACEGLLKHSVYHMASGKGVDECCSWGDYFYLEALTRVRKVWNLYW